ncbi:uncharacterized protein PG986_011776 [Apiospora aurea]|uniref:2EXR domain-containing protein n=1 Tax=Apiospora aurea TaxID=335848 RepID=A0ABR1PY51_9PEZI
MPAFRNFSNLPTDVRKRIWIFASIKPHTHVLLWYPSKGSIARQYTLFWPGVLAGQSRRCEYGLLLANKEASEVASQINKDTKPVSGLVHNLDLFINWDLDLLYVAGAMCAFDPLEPLGNLPCSSNIRNLALSVVGHTQLYDLNIFPWRKASLWLPLNKLDQVNAESNKAGTAFVQLTGLRMLKLVVTSVFSSPFDPTPRLPRNALSHQLASYAKCWTPLDAEPVGYNRRELRTLASKLPRDTHGFTNFRLLSPSLTYGIRPLLGVQFTEWSQVNDYCRELCDMIHHIRYKENQAAWGSLNVCLAVDLDSNFNRGDFPDEYRRVGIRRSSREWYMAPERPMTRR